MNPDLVHNLKKKLNESSLTFEDVESLKCSTRKVDFCAKLLEDSDFVPAICLTIKNNSLDSNIKAEVFKALINIATNEPKFRILITKSLLCTDHVCDSLILTDKDTIFLICRLVFVVSINENACKELSSNTKSFLTKIDPDLSATDDSLDGKILIDLMRIKFNQINHGILTVLECLNKFNGVLQYPINQDRTNIIGSFLNLFVAKTFENSDNFVFFANLKNDFLIMALDFYINLYRKQKNKDFLPTALLISIDQSSKCDGVRKVMRKHFLPNFCERKGRDNDYNLNSSFEALKSFLLQPDTSISFLSGEFLFCLCKGSVKRFVAHIGFEQSAGYLHAKGLLNSEIEEVEEVSDQQPSLSSDEEFFQANTGLESKLSLSEDQDLPKTPEEEAELAQLMQRISDYNQKSLDRS